MRRIETLCRGANCTLCLLQTSGNVAYSKIYRGKSNLVFRNVRLKPDFSCLPGLDDVWPGKNQARSFLYRACRLSKEVAISTGFVEVRISPGKRTETVPFLGLAATTTATLPLSCEVDPFTNSFGTNPEIIFSFGLAMSIRMVRSLGNIPL